MTTSEDQDIATLRNMVADAWEGFSLREKEDWKAYANVALDNLASTLAERDAELAKARAALELLHKRPYLTKSAIADTIQTFMHEGKGSPSKSKLNKILGAAYSVFEQIQCPEEKGRICELETRLAERDRRIAALEENLVGYESCAAENRALGDRLHALEARPAPAPGELAAAIRDVRELKVGIRAQLDRVIAAAESWQRLKWRPASEAPIWEPVVFRMPIVNNGRPDVDYWVDSLREREVEDEVGGVAGVYLDLTEDHGWDWAVVEAEAHCIRIADLPALPGGDDNG